MRITYIKMDQSDTHIGILHCHKLLRFHYDGCYEYRPLRWVLDGTSQTSWPQAGFLIGVTASPGPAIKDLSSYQRFVSKTKRLPLFLYVVPDTNRAEV
jgi:hypothetical protein